MAIKVSQLSMDIRHSDRYSPQFDFEKNKKFTEELYEFFRKYNMSILGENVVDLTEEYCKTTTTEWCSECNSETSVVMNNEHNICSECGNKLKPCNMCVNCAAGGNCIFD